MIRCRLKALADAHGKSLRQMLRGTGLSLATLSRHFRNLPMRVEIWTLDILCRYFRCDVNALFEYVPGEPPR